MARTSVVAAADVTIVSSFYFGGPTGKKRKLITATIYDPAATSGGWTIGGTEGDILATTFGLKKIEWCSNVAVTTTATGATTVILPAVPSLLGTGVLLTNAGSATDTAAARNAIADYTLATTNTFQITVVGY